MEQANGQKIQAFAAIANGRKIAARWVERRIMGENKTEDNENKACIFPKCPKCKKGYLLPFSYKEDVFEKWKCSECGYTIEKR